MKDRFRSPFSTSTATTTAENDSNGNHSEEYQSPEKVILNPFFYIAKQWFILIRFLLRQEPIVHFEMPPERSDFSVSIPPVTVD